MDRHPVRQDHLSQPRRQRAAGQFELAAPAATTGFTFPLLLWLTFQLLAVALTAGRVPLWAKYPPTGETLALKALLVMQLLASAILFPVLVRTVQSSAAVIITAWPFALVAAALSSTPMRAVVWAESYISVWIAALCAWRSIVCLPRSLAIASAVAVCLVLSGPTYRYLLAEFSADSSPPATAAAIHSTPMASAFSLLTADRRLAAPILGLSFLLMPPLVSLVYRRYRERTPVRAD